MPQDAPCPTCDCRPWLDHVQPPDDGFITLRRPKGISDFEIPAIVARFVAALNAYAAPLDIDAVRAMEASAKTNVTKTSS